MLNLFVALHLEMHEQIKTFRQLDEHFKFEDIYLFIINLLIQDFYLISISLRF